ncbi:MAG: hypothetical protein OXU77_20995 [Gammaproteobacteria bacterium]|nr:hypothetical protein [Gammaproteobacteria bacterium]MDE0440680.1 hypothetical protein [Gammaproteobacteria bacterium]
MNLTPLYVGTLLVAVLLVIEYRAVRSVIVDAARLRRIFSFRPSDLGLSASSPTNGRLGARIPDFAAREVQGGRPLDRASLLGASTMLVFFRAIELDEWDDFVLTSFLHNCRAKIDGNVYVVFRRGDRYEESFGVESIRANFQEGVVIVDDGDNGLWQALGIAKTPCAVLLDGDGVIRSQGRFVEPRGMAALVPLDG